MIHPTLYARTFKYTCVVLSALYVWTTLSQYILLCMQWQSTQYTWMIHPTPYIRMFHPINLQDTPHIRMLHTVLLYILLCMQRCSIQYTCMIHITLYGRMLYTTNLYYTSYLVCQDISIKYTLCMSACFRQYTCMIHPLRSMCCIQ